MLSDQELMAFLATSKPAEALVFYRDLLGLRLVSDDPFALVFAAGSVSLRIQKVSAHQPLPYTSLGWKVTDIGAKVQKLSEGGARFERFAGLEQDAQGIWTAPSGARIAWFKDPDGNTLSLSQF